MIIGICGKSGSGKSTLANKLIELDSKRFVHLDIDKVGHKVLLLPEVKKELINSFGERVVNKNIVDRKKLGEIVFNSRNQMDRLTDITWKYMQSDIDNFLNKNKDKIIILDWLLLPVTKYFNMCDIKILLDLPYEIRKERAILRDNITSESFDLRESSSIDFNYDNFDCVFCENNINSILRKVSDKILEKNVQTIVKNSKDSDSVSYASTYLYNENVCKTKKLKK